MSLSRETHLTRYISRSSLVARAPLSRERGALAPRDSLTQHTSSSRRRCVAYISRIWVSLERDPYAYSGVCLSRERHTPSSMALKGHARFIGATLKGCPVDSTSLPIYNDRVPRSEQGLLGPASDEGRANDDEIIVLERGHLSLEREVPERYISTSRASRAGPVRPCETSEARRRARETTRRSLERAAGGLAVLS